MRSASVILGLVSSCSCGVTALAQSNSPLLWDGRFTTPRCLTSPSPLWPHTPTCASTCPPSFQANSRASRASICCLGRSSWHSAIHKPMQALVSLSLRRLSCSISSRHLRIAGWCCLQTLAGRTLASDLRRCRAFCSAYSSDPSAKGPARDSPNEKCCRLGAQAISSALRACRLISRVVLALE